MKQHEDKIEYLIANESRQKRVAVLSVLIFIGAAAAIIILSLRIITLQQKNKHLNKDNRTLTRELVLRDSIIALQTALFERFQDSVSQSRIIRQQQDYLEAGMVQSMPEYPPHAIAPPPSGTGAKPVVKTPVKAASASKGKPALPPQQPQVSAMPEMLPPAANGSSAAYTIYIQYAAGARPQQLRLLQTLRQQRIYKVPAPELISGQRFGASIRYFNKGDMAAAQKLATIASRNCGLDFAVQFVGLKAPPGQLEVWIGDEH